MANNIVGFIGIEAHDLILYLSKILRALDRKVLLVDYVDHSSLSISIPTIIPGEVLDHLVDYQGISYTKIDISKIQHQHFDDIMINFGFIQKEQLLSQCSQLIYVVDQQRHHIESIIPLKSTMKKELLLRNMVASNIDEPYIYNIFHERIELKEQDVQVLYYDERDLGIGLLAQYNEQFTFRKLSKDMKVYLQNKIKELCPELQDKMRKKAYRAAERGN